MQGGNVLPLPDNYQQQMHFIPPLVSKRRETAFESKRQETENEAAPHDPRSLFPIYPISPLIIHTQFKKSLTMTLSSATAAR